MLGQTHSKYGRNADNNVYVLLGYPAKYTFSRNKASSIKKETFPECSDEKPRKGKIEVVFFIFFPLSHS